jgi:hypothetical protein
MAPRKPRLLFVPKELGMKYVSVPIQAWQTLSPCFAEVAEKGGGVQSLRSFGMTTWAPFAYGELQSPKATFDPSARVILHTRIT